MNEKTHGDMRQSWDVVLLRSSFDLFDRSRRPTFSYVICLAALLPSSCKRIIRKLHETVGKTNAIFRDAWVLTA